MFDPRNASNVTTYDNFFDAVYEKNFYLVFANLLSVANILFITPLYYGVIWYEKFGSNHNRSLVNQVKFIWHRCTLEVLGKIYFEFGITLIFSYFQLQVKLT